MGFFNFFKRPDYWPCCLSGYDTLGMTGTDVLKKGIYKPAIQQDGITIPLSGKELKQQDLPKTEAEIEKFKQNLRYVWVDGYESATYTERKIKYLGIRITDNLVLHETIWYGWGWDVCVLKEKIPVRLLSYEELLLVGILYDEISKMREKAHDAPLHEAKNALFWVNEDVDGKSDFVYLNGEVLQYRESEDSAEILLAVINR